MHSVIAQARVFMSRHSLTEAGFSRQGFSKEGKARRAMLEQWVDTANTES
jgi:hypothetical protein